MLVTYEQVRKVLETLPIGYYFGRDMSVTLDKTGTATFIDLSTLDITISYPMIAQTMIRFNADSLFEQTIRGLLYHEISHAILPPYSQIITVLKRSRMPLSELLTDKKLQEIINIVEDERIETVMQGFYMNTDFKQNLINITGGPTIDGKAHFFDVVRFGYDPTGKFIQMANALRKIGVEISKDCPDYKNINADLMLFKLTNSSNITSVVIQMAYYMAAVELYQAIEQDNLQQVTQPEQIDQSQPKPGIDPGLQNQAEQARVKAIKKIVKNPERLAAATKFENCIRQALKHHANYASGTHAYSGRIDPRRVNDRSYKWFAKKVDNSTSQKQFDKIHMTLWCDNSGSFFDSQDKMNYVLAILKSLERDMPDFSISVLHIGNDVYEPDQVRPYLKCKCKSYLTYKAVHDNYVKHTKSNATNYNIVVMDGLFQICDNAFSVFNRPNCYIVSDTSNETLLDRLAPAAYKKYAGKDYVDNFINILADVFQKALS